MSEESLRTSKRLLDPMERISEVLFGLIMVLAITSSIGVAGGESQQVRTMLVGAIGCNLAWGIIDGIFYLMAILSEKGHGIVALRALRQTTDPIDAQRIIADEMPPLLASALSPAEFELIHQRLNQMPDFSGRRRLSLGDWFAALGVFLLVFLSTFPVVIPFMFTRDARMALHISNGVAIVMLFLTGRAFGKYAGRPPWRTGLWMVALGLALVGIAKVLGG